MAASLLTASDLVWRVVGGEPRPQKGGWEKYRKRWEKRSVEGVCCFCGKRGRVADLGSDLHGFGLQNFTDWARRRADTAAACLQCLGALKEYSFMNPGFGFFLTPSSAWKRVEGKGEKGGDSLRPEVDGTCFFSPDDRGHRLAFLERMVSPPPEPFICGFKRPQSHALLFSPVNRPGAKIVQVWFYGEVVNFDTERYGGLVEAAVAWGNGGGGPLPRELRDRADLPAVKLLIFLAKP